MNLFNKISIALLASSLLLTTGCIKLWTDPLDIKTYMIETERTTSALPSPLADKLWIDTVTVLPPFNVRNILFRENDVEFKTSYYTEMLLSPAENFQNEFYTWFSASGIFSQVSLADRHNMSHRLQVSVLKFYDDSSTEPNQAVLEIKATLIDEKTNGLTVLFSKNYSQRVDLSDSTARELIRAYGQALQAILSDCEADTIHALRHATSSPRTFQ